MRNNNVLFFPSLSPEVMTFMFYLKDISVFLHNILPFLSQLQTLSDPTRTGKDLAPLCNHSSFSQCHYFSWTNRGLYLHHENNVEMHWHILLAISTLIGYFYAIEVFLFWMVHGFELRVLCLLCKHSQHFFAF
jgi:hypothetical protein